jgi:hypothetical protein
MNSRSETLRGPSSYRRGPPQHRQDVVGHNVVSPLSGPSYGAYNVVKRRWRKPLSAIIFDALANSRAVLARLDRGLYMPDEEGKPHYQSVFNALAESTRQQINALEAFSRIEWRE